ncbi:PQQ-binding-like beta-propeller repeat protein [Oscillatoria amoena NRMC-F 0135]|nr:PQQ-binding-like beta-propeller repeat protein [Oscillatoria amoena NRMC-F 0135]
MAAWIGLQLRVRYLDTLERRQRQPAAPASAPAQPTDAEPAASANAFVYRANNLRNGHVDGPSPIALQLLWKWIDPEDELAMMCSSVAAHGDWIYGATATLTGTKSSGAIFCLNARTGQPRWSPVFAFQNERGAEEQFKGFFSSPAITSDGGSLIIGEGLHLDRNSALICIDTATGAIRWRVQTPLHLESSPAIEGDVVVIGAGSIERASDGKVAPGDNPGFVLAVRISDGQELWRYPVNDPECSPAIHDGVVYIGSGFNGKHVVALRIEPDDELKARGVGRELWRTPTPHPVLSAITVHGDLLLFGCGDGDYLRAGPNGAVIAIDRHTGQVRWQTSTQTIGASVLSPVAVRGDAAVVGVGNGEVVSLNLADGTLRWRQRVTDAGGVNAGCAVTDEHIYSLTSDGWLAVLRASDGALLERHFVNEPSRPGELGMSFSAPLVVGGRVYVGSETGGVRAFSGATP